MCIKMAKRWTYKEDLFLVEYYDAVGSFIGPHDLGRSEASTKSRVKKLKECGAWKDYKTSIYYDVKARLLAGHCNPEFVNLDDYTKGI